MMRIAEKTLMVYVGSRARIAGILKAKMFLYAMLYKPQSKNEIPANELSFPGDMGAIRELLQRESRLPYCL